MKGDDFRLVIEAIEVGVTSRFDQIHREVPAMVKFEVQRYLREEIEAEIRSMIREAVRAHVRVEAIVRAV